MMPPAGTSFWLGTSCIACWAGGRRGRGSRSVLRELLCARLAHSLLTCFELTRACARRKLPAKLHQRTTTHSSTRCTRRPTPGCHGNQDAMLHAMRLKPDGHTCMHTLMQKQCLPRCKGGRCKRVACAACSSEKQQVELRRPKNSARQRRLMHSCEWDLGGHWGGSHVGSCGDGSRAPQKASCVEKLGFLILCQSRGACRHP
jgi:hypothetical protein